MKIKIKRWENEFKEKELEDFVGDCLASDRDGSFEQVEDRGEKLSAAFGKLIDILAEKKVLDVKDITKILQSWQTIEFL